MEKSHSNTSGGLPDRQPSKVSANGEVCITELHRVEENTAIAAVPKENNTESKDDYALLRDCNASSR